MFDRRAFLGLMAAALTMPLAACGQKEETVESEQETTEATTDIANPFVDCASASEAAELAGFEVSFPESVPGYETRQYQAIEGEMAQCFYYHNNDTSVLIRKAIDDGSGDVSGDYNEYPSETGVLVGPVEVIERGDGELVHVAIWSREGYLFAIDADEGLAAGVIEELVAATR